MTKTTETAKPNTLIPNPLRKHLQILFYIICGHCFLNGQKCTHQVHTSGGGVEENGTGERGRGIKVKKLKNGGGCLLGTQVFIILSPCTFCTLLKPRKS